VTFWGLADYQVNEIIEVFAEREQAERMLRDYLADEPGVGVDPGGRAARARVVAELARA